ncbi:hypothetical protein QFC22_005922 [Naganishia vaughanmartiniae]|uniref:Uncharacterized protein n=1 Tax=Naganishia vaughanmartiniae TaxID=1424756 RepID=A0ACC2WQW3_9TREE|nr:hypothetical protein QFC22_005922 [Naganishia vaughanmartiniae]
MKSIDIRSEPAVRLLADFLDECGSLGRDRRGAEHFAHEVYSFLRSPYRDLALYDAIAQYDKPAWEPEHSADSDSEDSDIAPARHSSPVKAARGDVIDVDACSLRKGGRSPARSRGRVRSPSIHSSASDLESDRSVLSVDKRRKRVKRSGRRWDEADSYVVPPSPATRRRNWHRKDSWVDPDLAVEVKRKQSIPLLSKASDSGVELRNKQPNGKGSVIIPDRPPAVHRGMRGWGEIVEADVEQPGTGTAADIVPAPQTIPTSPDPASQTASTNGNQKPSLELRIFGIAPRGTAPEQTDSGLVSASISKISYDTDDEERALTDAIWAPESTSMDHADVHGVSRTSAGSQAQNAIKEKLKAKLMKEKMQSSSTTAQSATAVPSGESGISSASDATGPEYEAKARARLALKLRLEKEKAIAQGRAKETQPAPTEAGERAAALRAKLLEKKLANSQAIK